MIYECRMCGTTFMYEDGEHKKGYLVCPSCDSEDLDQTEALLEVDGFAIELEILADADWNKHDLKMDWARNEVVEAVIKALDKEDRKRLELYQERNNPCKEVE